MPHTKFYLTTITQSKRKFFVNTKFLQGFLVNIYRVSFNFQSKRVSPFDNAIALSQAISQQEPAEKYSVLTIVIVFNNSRVIFSISYLGYDIHGLSYSRILPPIFDPLQRRLLLPCPG